MVIFLQHFAKWWLYGKGMRSYNSTPFSPFIKKPCCKHLTQTHYSPRVTGMWLSIQSRVPTFSKTVSWADIFNILGLCPCFSTNRNRQFQKRMRASRRRLMSYFWAWAVRAFLYVKVLGGTWLAEKTQNSSAQFFLLWRSFFLFFLCLYVQCRASLKPL